MSDENKQKPKSDYIVFYEEFVLPTIETCLNEISDPNFRIEYEPVFLDEAGFRKRYAKTFRSNRRKLKDLFYGDDEHNYLNPMKLAAVLCHTLIDCKPIRFQGNVNINEHTLSSYNSVWLANNLLINYKIAFLSSISVVYSQILAEKEPDENSDFVKTGQLAKYGCYDRNSFQTNVIINLASNALLGRVFDDLMFALMMFQWYEYTLKCFDIC